MGLWQGALTLFILLGLSHVLCILAHKEEGIIRTVGYTLAACIVILSILFIITELGVGSDSPVVEKATPKIEQHIQTQVKSVQAPVKSVEVAAKSIQDPVKK